MIPTNQYLIHKRGLLKLVPLEDKQHRKQARVLINEAGLPVDGLDETELYGLFDGDEMIGTVGLEVFDYCALLRSLVVAPEYRGEGLGRKMVKKMMSRSKMLGVRQIFTLTESADRLLVKMGFLPRRRENMPKCVLPSSQTDLPACSRARLYERNLPPLWVNSPFR